MATDLLVNLRALLGSSVYSTRLIRGSLVMIKPFSGFHMMYFLALVLSIPVVSQILVEVIDVFWSGRFLLGGLIFSHPVQKVFLSDKGYLWIKV